MNTAVNEGVTSLPDCVYGQFANKASLFRHPEGWSPHE